MKALGATAIHILEERQRCCLGQESSSLAPPMLMVLLLQCLQRFPPGFRIDPQTPSLHLHLLPRWLSFISSNTTCSSCPQDLCTCCARCVKYSPPHFSRLKPAQPLSLSLHLLREALAPHLDQATSPHRALSSPPSLWFHNPPQYITTELFPIVFLRSTRAGTVSILFSGASPELSTMQEFHR